MTNTSFSSTSLILAEFQYRRNLDAIKTALSSEFDVILERRMPWSDILATDGYEPTLAGDEYGLVFLLRRGQRRFRKLAEGRSLDVPQPAGAEPSESSATPTRRSIQDAREES